MKISIVRHFEVECPYEPFLTSSQFKKWCRSYDSAPLKQVQFSYSEDGWDACYSSDLPRAVKTAEMLYGKPIQTPLLREVPLSPFVTGGPRFPYAVWTIMGRLCWLLAHPSQDETGKQSAERARLWIEEMEGAGHQHILAVSHGFFIPVLADQLRKKGYQGRKTGRLKNGELVVYEK